MNKVQLSKRLSYLLRHAPQEEGLTLEPGGWAPLEPLLKHLHVTREQVEAVVVGNDKQRFSLNGERIWANQGHSVPVDLELEPTSPPATLYHGTGRISACWNRLRREGLRPMQRHHVHLSPDQATARQVGARRGSPVILEVDAARMHAGGYLFYRSANGVWLVAQVPQAFIRFPA